MWRENCANKVQLERDVECSENCLLVHIAALDPVIYSTQAGTTWSLSSQADLIPKKSSKWKCWHSHQKYLIYMSFWRQKINLSIPATKMECFQILLVLRRIEDSLADLLVLTNSAAQKILTNWKNSLTLFGTTCASPIQLLFASSWKSSLSCWLLNILNIWRKPFLPKLGLHPARPWCGWLGNNDALVGCKLDGLAPVSAIDSSLRKIYQWGGVGPPPLGPSLGERGGGREREREMQPTSSRFDGLPSSYNLHLYILLSRAW